MGASTNISHDTNHWLSNCEYPHRWKLREQLKTTTKSMMEHLTFQFQESKLLQDELPFNFLMTYISLAYECFMSNEIEKGLSFLQNGEKKFLEFCNQKNICSLSPAFLHIIKATRLFLRVQKGDAAEIIEIVSSVPEVTEMDIRNKAAVQYGFPAFFIGNFGLDGCRLALNYLSRAIESDPTESIWYYTRAEYIGNLERAERLIDKMPSDEEFDLLDKALHIKRAAIYTSYSAGLYRQCAKELNRPIRILATRTKHKPRIEEFNKRSWKLYEESMELNPRCVETLFRCARGFLLLPPPYRDIPRAKELLDKAFPLAPDSGFGNLVMGEYYKINQNPHKAMNHLRVCEKKKLYGPTMFLIRLEYQSHLEIDFVHRLENLLHVFERDLEKSEIFYEIVTYYNFVLKDLRKACEYTEKILEFGKLGDFVLQCRPSGAFCTPGFNQKTLYNLLIDCLEQTEGESPEDREYFKSFLERLLARKITAVDPTCKEDAVTFNKVAPKSSLYRLSNDKTWRRNEPSSQPVLSWRRQSMGPPTAKQTTKTGSNSHNHSNVQADRALNNTRNLNASSNEEVTNSMGKIRI